MCIYMQVTEPCLLAHELGHNVGLFHSWQYGNPSNYGDRGDVMGVGNMICHNAPNLHALGWSKPAAIWNAAQLPPGTWRTVTLPAQYMSDTNFLMVRPNWLDDPVYRSSGIYVSYRVARGNEAGLIKEIKGNVQVHSYIGSLALNARNNTQIVANVSAGELWPSSVSD